MKTYDHVVREVYGQPWFTTEDHLATIAGIVRERATLGESLTREEVRSRMEAVTSAGPRGGARVQGAVGVIPVYGTIMPRANLFTEFSGGATCQGISRAFREALADEAIGSIVLEFDSPGGEVGGVDELATEIREARGRKPIVAVANGLMCSAAYYIGSQADEVVAAPSSLVGSIGCITVHSEESRWLEQEGITVTVLRQPALKAEATPWEPLSPEARAHLQERTDDYALAFQKAVATARGVPLSAVKAGYGQGRALTAKRAHEAQLVDRVATLEDTILRLASGKGPVSKGTKAEEGERPVWLDEANRAGHDDPALLADALAAGDITRNDARTAPEDRSAEAQAGLALARARADRR